MGGVEINGKPFPLSYELQNGDGVSILTGGGKPSTDWMRYATTRSTRSKLRAYFRKKATRKSSRCRRNTLYRLSVISFRKNQEVIILGRQLNLSLFSI